MGMFDTVIFLDDSAPRCPAGHPVREVQTKDLTDDDMGTFYVYGERIWASAPLPAPTPALDGDVLVLTYTARLAPLAHSGDIEIYYGCRTCLPVLTFSDGGTLGLDCVNQHESHLEWTLTLREGQVQALRPNRAESRDDLRAELLRRGLDVLADDDRLAVKHFARREAGGGSRFRRR